jgi:hypothetical protein
MNTYFQENSIFAPVVTTSKTMYISSLQIGSFLYNVLSSDETTIPELYAESQVEIGTILILKIAPSSYSLSRTIDRVEVDGQPILFTRINETEISIEIASTYSGNMIVVHIQDTNYTGGDVIPVYIFPRQPQRVASCVECPPGTFSGTYNAIDVSSCLSKNVSSIPKRRLLSHMSLSESTVFGEFVHIENQFIRIQSLERIYAGGTVLYNAPDVSFQVWLETKNMQLVQNNTDIIVKRVLKIYDAENKVNISKVSGIWLHHNNMSTVLTVDFFYATPSGVEVVNATPSSVEVVNATPSSVEIVNATSSSVEIVNATPSSVEVVNATPSSVEVVNVTPSSVEVVNATPSSVVLWNREVIIISIVIGIIIAVFSTYALYLYTAENDVPVRQTDRSQNEYRIV